MDKYFELCCKIDEINRKVDRIRYEFDELKTRHSNSDSYLNDRCNSLNNRISDIEVFNESISKDVKELFNKNI